MTADELKKKYLGFFVKKGHKVLANVSLVPEDDSTTLFISAGMQPLVPYLLGEPHPLGKRLVSLQRCLRTGDIESVGNVYHNTFFEMLGNWSLGDYWKKESLTWSYEFLTKVLGLNPKQFHVTIFAGDKDAPKDEETEKIWFSLGIPPQRIYSLPKKDNWWEAAKTGPGGPDSEIFYDIGKPVCGPSCRPGDGCGRFFEMWNNVFMEYNRKPDGSYEKLKQKNVDTGMGVERTTAVLEGKEDIYQTELFTGLREEIIDRVKLKATNVREKRIRIFLDHSRAVVFLVAEGLFPGNKDREYILRRLIRRADDQLNILGVENKDLWRRAVGFYCQNFVSEYEELRNVKKIEKIILQEVSKYERTVTKTVTIAAKAFITKKISGREAFNLYSTYGFSKDQLRGRGYIFDESEFEEAKREHQELSRAGVKKKFAGGLADRSEEAIKLHTTTHLLHQALRGVLGEHVRQVGSNITSERLRFDFTHPEKLTNEQIKKVETIVNQKIKENWPVKMKMMTPEQAKKSGALAFFGERYGEQVKVYTIGDYSKEVCGGPHVDFTGEIGDVKIIKEKPVGAARRRLYAKLAHGS